MILLSHERQCFSRTNKRSARRRPPASASPYRVDRDLAYLIRTLLRFSAQREPRLSSHRLHRRQPVASSHDLLSPLRQFQRQVAVLGSVTHLLANDPGDLLTMAPDGDHGKVHTRDGQHAISQVPYRQQQQHDGAAAGLTATGPISSPSTSHTDTVISVRFTPSRTLLAGGRDKPVQLQDATTHLARTVLVQPIFEPVLRAAPTTQTTQICLQTPHPPQPVRPPVNQCGSQRPSGDTHRPHSQQPLHYQACQRSLTRKRSPVQIQYRPQRKLYSATCLRPCTRVWRFGSVDLSARAREPTRPPVAIRLSVPAESSGPHVGPIGP
jgi:hypothetical protein